MLQTQSKTELLYISVHNMYSPEMDDLLHLLKAKEKECYQQNNKSGNFDIKDKFCELIFDGIMCWPATKAGILAIQPCPVHFMNPKDYVSKKCENNGEWYVHNELNKTWTNYSQCWQIIDEETALVPIPADVEKSTLYHTWFPIIKSVSHWGYGISLTALISAMIIFLSIKKLQCARNRLHMHLFMSFIMRAFMSLLKDFLFIEGIAMQSAVVYVDGKPQYIKQYYSWMCKAIISARNYFIIANYMLVLMEGIYLHNLMFLTLFSDNSKITVYCVMGWGLPLLFVIPWIIVRIYYEDKLCWTTSENKYYPMLIEAPITLSVFVNFALFVMIMRVLLVKLNSMYIQHRRTKYRRLIRSTLILVPLFGVPYVISLIMYYSSTTNKTMELIWIFSDQTFISFQGFFVALVYCLLNSEVHMEIKHKYNSIRDRHQHFRRSRERTISHTQQFTTTVLPLQEEIFTTNGHAKPISDHGQTTIL